MVRCDSEVRDRVSTLSYHGVLNYTIPYQDKISWIEVLG